MTDQTKGLIYAGLTAVMWGFLAVALKAILNVVDPVSVTWFRFALAFFALLIFLFFTDRSYTVIIKRPPLILFAAAILLGLNYLGFISGVNRTSAVNAQVFIQIGPVCLALAGVLIFKEKLNWKHLTGFIILVTGLFVFYSEQINGTAGNGEVYARGITYIILGGIAWAGFSVFQKMLVKSRNANHLNLFIYGFSTLAFLPFVQFQSFLSLNLMQWSFLVFCGLNTVVSYGTLALALKYAEANKVSVIITLNPILTFILMGIIGGSQVSWIRPEHFTLLTLGGAALVFAGAAIVVMTRRKNGR